MSEEKPLSELTLWELMSCLLEAWDEENEAALQRYATRYAKRYGRFPTIADVEHFRKTKEGLHVRNIQ